MGNIVAEDVDMIPKLNHHRQLRRWACKRVMQKLVNKYVKKVKTYKLRIVYFTQLFNSYKTLHLTKVYVYLSSISKQLPELNE